MNAFGVFAVVCAAIVAVGELPKIARMCDVDKPYAIFPFARVAAPVVSKSRRIWLIAHTLSGAALVALMCAWAVSVPGEPLLWCLNGATALFLALVLGNSSRLGSHSGCPARTVNLTMCFWICFAAAGWTFSHYAAAPASADFCVVAALAILMAPPLLSAYTTLHSRCSPPASNQNPLPAAL
jgi:hypothetical protein